MRRFINSLPGRILSQVCAIALLVPFVSFISATRAEAQFQTLPVLAVVDFENTGKGGPEIGAKAAAAIAQEFQKLNKYDVVPQETVQRTAQTESLQQPITQVQSLLRLGNSLRASSIVSGKVVDWRIVNVDGGKRADVILYVVVRDVASGLGVNGGSLSASSSVRASSVDDATVLDEAIGAASSEVVRVINGQTLPTGTVLNTVGDTALVNQGTRTGMRQGLELVVVRGRQQVATAVVTIVEPDSSTIKITKQILGTQPGDKVRGIITPPEPQKGFGNNGQIQYSKPARKNKSSDFATLAIVLGLAVILTSGGRSSDFQGAGSFTSEAAQFPDFSGQAAVRLKWSGDLLTRGNYNQVQWLIRRSDVPLNPVLSADRNIRTAFDTDVARDVTWGDFGGAIGGSTCNNTSNPVTTTLAVPGITAGRPYTYEIQLVYKVASFDLPGASASTTGGNTAGTAGGTTTGGTNTTGGTTTAGTTGGNTGGNTAGTAGTDCYFVSPRQAARGIATPLNRSTLISPSSGATVASDENFTFGSVVTPNFPITVEYALQFSSDETFLKKTKIKTYGKIIRTDIGTLAFVPSDYRGSFSSLLNRLRSDFGTSSQQLFWRVGARNVADVPGPVADVTGQRYIWSASRRIVLPTVPPPPPSE